MPGKAAVALLLLPLCCADREQDSIHELWSPSGGVGSSGKPEDYFVALYGTPKSHHIFEHSKQTWLKGFPSIFVSDVDDSEIPTVAILGQSEQKALGRREAHPWGHIFANDGDNKPLEMIQYANRTRGGSFKWLLIGDDDTCFKLPALTQYLSTLDSDLSFFIGKCNSELKCWNTEPRCSPCCLNASRTCKHSEAQSIDAWALKRQWQPPAWPYGKAPPRPTPPPDNVYASPAHHCAC